jgi:hypothetical protein
MTLKMGMAASLLTRFLDGRREMVKDLLNWVLEHRKARPSTLTSAVAATTNSTLTTCGILRLRTARRARIRLMGTGPLEQGIMSRQVTIIWAIPAIATTNA